MRDIQVQTEEADPLNLGLFTAQRHDPEITDRAEETVTL